MVTGFRYFIWQRIDRLIDTGFRYFIYSSSSRQAYTVDTGFRYFI